MATLRISFLPAPSPEADRALVQATLPDGRRLQAEVDYLFRVSADEWTDLHWYFEVFLQFDEEPAPARAIAIERHLQKRGRELFGSILDGNDEVRSLWRAFRPHLADSELEIVSREGAGTAIYWEFMQEPDAGEPLAIKARAFVHVPEGRLPGPPIAPRLASPDGLRVLLAIERPAGAGDVPYRSVAGGLVGAADPGRIRIDVLRPPTFDRLAAVLVEAARAGKPYDVLHFDGHGVYGALGSRPGARGYVLFEDPRSATSRPVDGRTLGELMARTEVETLVLNACRSAYADPRTAKRGPGAGPDAAGARMVGSFAEEAIRGGARHVVGMRYNLYVVTATRFVASLYDALTHRSSLGQAVAGARRNLALRPERKIADAEMPLQDWAVPALYRAEGVAEPSSVGPPSSPSPQPSATGGDAASRFVGRHETLYRIDRWLDYWPVVLVRGQAGTGKSATAREFARWYERTGGAVGPVELTQLADASAAPLPLDDDRVELPDFVIRVAERRGLWVVDGLERLASARAPRLLTLVLAAADRGAKIVVLSRGDPGWKHPRVGRVHLPTMPRDEYEELARARLVHARGITNSGVRALLRFGRGNPQVMHLLLDLSRAEGATDPQALEKLVADVAAGDVDLELPRFWRLREVVDDLRAAVPAFGATAQAWAAPLRLFRGVATVVALGTMGQKEEAWHLPALEGATGPGLTELFGQLVQAGLADDFQLGMYRLHPLLPLALRPLFDAQNPPGEPARRAREAFCGALAKGCSFAIMAYNKGASLAVDFVAQHEASVADAWVIACREGLWSQATSILSARCMVASAGGNDAALGRLLEESALFLVDTASNGPILGRESGWRVWASFRVRLLRRRGDLPGADALRAGVIAHLRRSVADALRDGRTGPLTAEEQGLIYSLASELYHHGADRLGRGDPASVGILSEAAELARRADSSGLAKKIEMTKVRATWLAADPPTSVPASLLDAIGDADGSIAAVALQTLGDNKLRLAERLLADDPAETARDARLAQAHDLLREVQAAFQRALAVLPPHMEGRAAETYLRLGETQIQLRDSAAAQTSLARALRGYERAHDPGGAAAARVALAMALRADGRLDQAAICANAALDYYREHDPVRAAHLQSAFSDLAALDGAPTAVQD